MVSAVPVEADCPQPPTVYLAGPIDQDHGREADASKHQARTMLSARGAVVFDPSLAWVAGAKPGPATQLTNDAAIDNADGVLALLPPGVATVGTPVEVARAAGRGIPVAVVADDPPVGLMGLPAMFFRSVADAGEWLLDEIAAWNVPSDRPLVERISEHAALPTRAYDGDAGWDLYVDEDVIIAPNTVADVPSGIAVAIPYGQYGRIVGRSSTHRKRGLSVVEGIIDAGYRGPLFAGVWNPQPESIRVERGERLAQLILCDVPAASFVEVGELPPSLRGRRGFGSSG